MFELSSLLIPIISLATGIFFYLGAATTTLEAKAHLQVKPASVVRNHQKNPNIWNLSQGRNTPLRHSSLLRHSSESWNPELRVSNMGLDSSFRWNDGGKNDGGGCSASPLAWQTESSSTIMFLLSFPGDHPTTLPIEPLTMAKGSRAPPGGTTTNA